MLVKPLSARTALLLLEKFLIEEKFFRIACVLSADASRGLATQRGLLNFARARARNVAFADKENTTRHLVARERLAAERSQIFFVGIGSELKHDEGSDVLATHCIG